MCFITLLLAVVLICLQQFGVISPKFAIVIFLGIDGLLKLTMASWYRKTVMSEMRSMSEFDRMAFWESIRGSLDELTLQAQIRGYKHARLFGPLEVAAALVVMLLV